MLICHKLSDLWAQSADGTAAAKVAAGLLADIGTRVIFQQRDRRVGPPVEEFARSVAISGQTSVVDW